MTTPDGLPSHIFIVGVHRSGTSLMRFLLNDCSLVHVCDETHYMGHLIPSAGMRQHFRRFQPLTDDANVQRLVDHMYDPAFRRYSRFKEIGWQWTQIMKFYDRETVRERLLACDRSEPAVFDVVMGLIADREGAVVRGEKTPIHMRWTEELLAWYPGAKVVHIIRDPRAVHVSDLKRRREQTSRAPVYRLLRRLGPLFDAFMAAQTTYYWRDSVRRARRMSASFPDRYLVVRFEDVVGDPQRTIPTLCADLGIPFEEKMLDRTVVSEGFRAGEKGFDTRAARRWEAHIGKGARRWYDWWFGDQLREFGYEQ
jgi:hypothetical protein